MDLSPSDFGERSRLRALRDHFSIIEDKREPHRVAYPLAELLLLAVCGTIADCDDYENIAGWGETHLDSCGGFCRFITACRRAVADDHDEPGQSGAVFGVFLRLGSRLLARPSRAGGHRREDFKAQP